MRKPQQKTTNEEIFLKSDYPREMFELKEAVAEKVNNSVLEDIEEIVDIAYKSGYLDAWKEALFFME